MDAEISQYKLWCHVAGDFTYFSIKIDPSECLDDLRELILNKRKGLLGDLNVDGLMLFQVDINLDSMDGDSLCHYKFDTTHKLNRYHCLLSSIWPVQPPTSHLHVYVRPLIVTSFLLARQSHYVGERLHQVMWGRDLEGMLLEMADCGGLRYIPEAQVNELGLQDLGYNEKVLLVRHEYISAFDHLTSMSLNDRSGGVIVTGQPGIGKSCFLFYILLRRLCECRPTALDLGNVFLLFDNTGVHAHNTGFEGNFALKKGVWALTEASVYKQSCTAFYQSGVKKAAWVVKVTPPEREQWHGWWKELKMDHFVMNNFTSDELRALGIILGPEPDVEALSTRAQQMGF